MEADFVIIGSGSAGSAMAYRLGEDGKNSVLVLEYGGTDYGPFRSCSWCANSATVGGSGPDQPLIASIN